MRLTVDAIRVLLHLSENQDERVLPTDVFPRVLQDAVHDDLIEAGLIVRDDRLAGPPLFGLSRSGRHRVTANRAGYRATIVRDRVLRAVAEGTRDVTEVVAEPGDGGEFTTDELERAANTLGSWGFLNVTHEWSGKPILCLMTTEGHVQLESPYPTTSPTGQAGAGETTSYTVNNHDGSSGSVQVGDRNTMTINQTNGASVDQVMALLVDVRRIADMSDNADAIAYANSQVEEIETAIEDGRFETARALTSALLNSAMVTFGAAIGEQMVDPLSQVLGLVGGHA